MSIPDLTAVINWIALCIGIGFVLSGYFGLKSGEVKASSYAFPGDRKTYSGGCSRILCFGWIITGIFLIVVFGGVLLGIKEFVPLQNFILSLLGGA